MCLREGKFVCGEGICVCICMSVCVYTGANARLLGLFEALAWGSEEGALG